MEGLSAPQWGGIDQQVEQVMIQHDSPMKFDPPGFGLLSRTLIHSPVVKKILPARIRRSDLNDVVFIGETFIELHILTGDGKLQKIGSKTDFRAEIRDARVFGSQRESNLSGVPKEVATNGHGNEGFKPGLPADILVMTTDSGHLTFVYAKNSSGQDQIDFCVTRKRIESKGVHPKHLGKSIAVDPQSRAMAVAAYQDYFCIYSLRSMEELHQQMTEGLPLNPVKEERTFEVKGSFIVHMEFLYPAPEDKEHVILVLFLIGSDKKSRLQLYEWWGSKPLQSATRLGQNGLRLSEDISMPLHLIPLVISSAFLIVTEFYTHVVKASDIISGNATFAKVAFPITPSGGHKQSLVTAWARPFRHPVYSGCHDDMYLAMENGHIYYLEVDAQAHTLVQTATKASYLDCSIGTAFAALDYGLGYDDMLVAGGEMSSGGIYLLNIAAYPVDTRAKLEESVTNWAPVFDFELVNLSARGQVNGIAERDRVFACTGRGDHGAITELRYGIQARGNEPVEYLQGVHQLFILPDASGSGYFVLTSLANQSFLCYRSSGEDEEWLECERITSLELEETTLAAGPLALSVDGNIGDGFKERVEFSSWSVQVTPTAITVVQLFEEDTLPKQEVGMEIGEAEPLRHFLQRRCDGGDTITAAALYGRYVLVAIRNGQDVKLVLASIVIVENSDEFLVPVGAPVALVDDPTFVGIVELHDRLMAIVGTRQATVQVFLCDNTNGLLPIKEQNMLDHASGSQYDLAFCESAVILSTATATKLMCGLRGGTVVVFNVTVSESSLQLERVQEIRFGPIPVQLYLDVHHKNSVLALAGPEVYRFDMLRNKIRGAQLVFVLPDADKDPMIQAVVQVKNQTNQGSVLVCVADDQIFLADVGKSEKICSRRLRLYETPRRLLFYKHLDVFIVACSKPAGDGFTGLDGDKKSFCSLKVIDPKTGNSRLSGELRDSAKKDLIFGKPNEQIFCIAEWNLELNGKKYQYIALGTGIINCNLPDIRKGRVIILSLCVNAAGTIDVRKRFQVLCNEPVYSLSPYGSSSLLYCSGKNIYMKSLNLETKKLDLVAEAKLRSPAIQISVSEPLIYLSCTADSILVLKFENDILTETFSDEIARNGFHHAKFLEDLIVATDKQYSIVGLWQPANQHTLQSLKTVFEAELTSSVSRIHRGICRPPWVSPTRHLPGVVSGSQNVIAAGVDGSFYQLTILSNKALRLVRFVHALYHAEVNDGPYIPAAAADELLDPGDPRNAHVDGDSLELAVELGAGWLKAAVERTGDDEAFMDVARELLTGERDVFEEVIAYLDGLLNDAVL